MKHTPGPWEVDPSNLFSVTLPSDREGTCVALCSWIGHYEGRLRSEGQANAKLIAASPDLLDACKEALAFLEVVAPSRSLGPGALRKTRVNLITAIKKAEEEA